MTVGHHADRAASPFLCQNGLVCRQEAGESILMQKYNSMQGGQVHYTDAAAGHQITVCGL